jgi:hypothetical protein
MAHLAVKRIEIISRISPEARIRDNYSNGFEVFWLHFKLQIENIR